MGRETSIPVRGGTATLQAMEEKANRLVIEKLLVASEEIRLKAERAYKSRWKEVNGIGISKDPEPSDSLPLPDPLSTTSKVDSPGVVGTNSGGAKA